MEVDSIASCLSQLSPVFPSYKVSTQLKCLYYYSPGEDRRQVSYQPSAVILAWKNLQSLHRIFQFCWQAVEDTLVADTLLEDTLVEYTLVEDTLLEDILVEDTLVEDILLEDTLVKIHW